MLLRYKAQEMTVQEENQSSASDSASHSPASSIYSGINSLTLSQIKNIDVEGSFGTKIDTLARHILWIRENDPGAKSVIFSQFRDFLAVLARAFTKFKIGFASIDKKNGVENFKKDPSVSTCGSSNIVGTGDLIFSRPNASFSMPRLIHQASTS